MVGPGVSGRVSSRGEYYNYSRTISPYSVGSPRGYPSAYNLIDGSSEG